jgi:predicted ester cyclase
MSKSGWLFLLISLSVSNPIFGQGSNDMKSIARDLFETTWSKGDFENLDEVWDENTSFHFRNNTSVVNVEGLKGIIGYWRSAFPDLKFTVHDLVEENNRVAIRVSFTGTHLGKYGEIEPTGRRVNVSEMMFLRFENGKVVEAWEDYDEQGMLQQLTTD